MRGRYVGPITTTFEAPVGVVHYGDEFDLPKGREKSFLQHGYIEPADKAAKDLYKSMTSTKPVESPSVDLVPDITSEPDSSAT